MEYADSIKAAARAAKTTPSHVHSLIRKYCNEHDYTTLHEGDCVVTDTGYKVYRNNTSDGKYLVTEA